MISNLNFLVERPAKKDEYESGSHQRIAESILETLRYNDEVNVVGIEGELGSGKSTVINIIEQECEKEEFELIFFDVEKYQHGATKKALIETIYGSIKEGLNEEEGRSVKRAKDIALGNHLKYDVEVGSHLSGWVVLFALSLIIAVNVFKEAMAGLGNFLQFLFSHLEWFDMTPSDFSFDFLALVSLFTLLIPFEIYRRSLKQKKIFGHLPPKAGDLFKRNGTDTVEETFEINREVGAYELKEALGVFIDNLNSEKRYILVIDNIDRVTDDKLREVWSDIDVFSSIAHDRIKLLIPYSHTHVSKALCPANNSAYEGREFISKRLPITFRVSPVITADWKAHFSSMLDEAFKGIRQDEKLVIIRLIGLVGASRRSVTPRYLKCLVNSVVSTLMTKIDGVSTASAFFYQLTVAEGEVALESVLSKEQVTPQSSEGDDSNRGNLFGLNKAREAMEQHLNFEKWSKDLIAIHYQAPYKLAESELLIKPLELAIEESDPFPYLKRKGIFGYARTVQDVLADYGWERSFLLAEAMFTKVEDQEKTVAWLDDWIPVINKLATTDTREVKDLESLVRAGKVLSDTQIEIELTRFYEAYDQINEEVVGEEDVILLHSLSELLSEKPHVLRKVDVRFYNDVLWPKRAKLRYWKVDSIFLNREQILELIRLYEESELPRNLSIRILQLYKLGWHLSSDCPGNRVLPDVDISSVDYAVSDFKDLSKQIINANWLTEDTFEIYKHDGENIPEGDSRDAWYGQAVGLAVALNQPELINQLPSDINPSDQFFISLTEVLVFHCSMEYLLNALESSETRGYLGLPTSKLIQNKRIYSLDIVDCLKKFSLIKDKTDLSATAVAKWLETWIDEFDLSLKQFTELPNVFIKTVIENSDLASWRDKILSPINEASDEWWKKQLIEPSENLKGVVDWYFRSSRKLKSSKALSDALKELFKDHNSDTLECLDDRDWFNSVIEILPKSSRRSVIIALQKTMNEYHANKETQLAIYRLFGKFVMIDVNDKTISQELAITIFESYPENFDDKQLNFENWSQENLEQFTELLIQYEEDGNDFHKINKNKAIAKMKRKVNKSL